ncbi:hypothetical protein AB6713_09090 [Luteimonas sp. B3_2_R+30]|uniref:Next to BRCA1 central domain-containing protein n=2 Tax=Luteimonas salinilitoris TaxID=3237697 RepID=A0ABV4HQA6_9GAMM
MAPNGADTRSGLSEAQAVKTLGRVQAILQQTQPVDEVEVHIAPGTYLGQEVAWTYYNGKPITFTPKGFSDEVPVFDGQNGATWFALRASGGRMTNLRFRHLRIQNYGTAVSFNGNRNDLDGWNGGNELLEMYFYNIGGSFSASRSTAAVRLVNSRNNVIVDSMFQNVLDPPPATTAAHLHPIYAAHYAHDNLIYGNVFINAVGDPVKFRDASNNNRVLNNSFVKTGYFSFYQESYCEPSRPDCTKPAPECPSQGNEFRNNTLYGGYYGAVVPWMVHGAEQPPECAPPTLPRLQASANLSPSATFVSQSVPSTMIAGQTYSVSVTMRNDSGDHSWKSSEGFYLRTSNPPHQNVWGLGKVAVPGTVAPGAAATFNFTVRAPSTPGSYPFRWRLHDYGVTWVGQPSANLTIQVTAAPQIPPPCNPGPELCP